MNELEERVSAVRRRIADAANRRGREPSAVRLVAVAKKQPVVAIRAAYSAGVTDIGENYAQELVTKTAGLTDLPIAWHFVGRLQTNKAKDIVGRVRLVHSVDRIKLALELDRRARALGTIQDVLVEVNVGGESQKGGIAASAVPEFVEALGDLSCLRCLGLMALPPPCANPEGNRRHFRAISELAARCSLKELSMGMSDDFEVAVEEGATIVRIGTAIFGARETGK